MDIAHSIRSTSRYSALWPYRPHGHGHPTTEPNPSFYIQQTRPKPSEVGFLPAPPLRHASRDAVKHSRIHKTDYLSSRQGGLQKSLRQLRATNVTRKCKLCCEVGIRQGVVHVPSARHQEVSWMFRRSFSFPVETRRLRIGLLCGNGGPAKSVQDLQACHAESPFLHPAEDLGSWEHLCRQNWPSDLSKRNPSDDRKGCTMAPVSIQQPSGQVLLLGAFETPKDVTEDGSDSLYSLEEIVDTDSNGNNVNDIKESRFLETIESIYQLENDKQNDCQHNHLTEKEKVANESNLSMASKSYNIAELVHARNRLAEENAEIQKSMEMTEETNARLHSENTALKKQVKSIKQSILQAEELGDELEEVRSALSESSITNTKLQMSVKQLERENEILKDKFDCVTDEMASMLSEREVDKKKIIHLGSMLKVLENQLEEERLALNQKDEIVLKKDFVIEQLKNSLSEYSSVVQDLRDKVKDLQNQLAEMQQEAVLNAESVASGGFNNNVASEPSLGYELEQCTKEAKIDEEADDFGIVSGQFRRLWRRSVRLKTAVQSAGLLGLGFLLPLGVYTALMPTVQSHLGAPCSDSLWNAVRHYLKPYCSLSHVTPPPW